MRRSAACVSICADGRCCRLLQPCLLPLKGRHLLAQLGLLRLVACTGSCQLLPQRTLQEIQADIAKLGYNEKDYRETGINALESPITFLYESFSRRERSKRLVAQLENDDKKRELLGTMQRTIEVGAHEQWTAPGPVHGQQWVGLHFIDLSDEDKKVLEQWLAVGADGEA